LVKNVTVIFAKLMAFRRSWQLQQREADDDQVKLLPLPGQAEPSVISQA
jgi:hypothetical protein